VVALVLLIAAGCSTTEPMPTENFLTIAMTNSGRVTVVDFSGLLVTARKLDDIGVEGTHRAVAQPAVREIHVAWHGGACDASYLEIAGTSDALSMALDVNEFGAAPGGACDAIGLTHGLLLKLSEPVEQHTITFHLL
jgi:hypothetical protein